MSAASTATKSFTVVGKEKKRKEGDHAETLKPCTRSKEHPRPLVHVLND